MFELRKTLGVVLLLNEESSVPQVIYNPEV